MVELLKKENFHVLVGVVTEDLKDATKEGVKKKIVTLKDRNGDIVKLFYSNKASDESKRAQLANRIEKAGVCKGTFLVALAYVDEGKDVGTGVDFMCYSGLKIQKNSKDNNVSVIMGLACKPREPKDGMFCVNVPVKEMDGSTTWYSVAFFDSEKDGKTFKNATNAKKLLEEGNVRCAILGSDIREKDGYKNITGFHVETAPNLD